MNGNLNIDVLVECGCFHAGGTSAANVVQKHHSVLGQFGLTNVMTCCNDAGSCNACITQHIFSNIENMSPIPFGAQTRQVGPNILVGTQKSVNEDIVYNITIFLRTFKAWSAIKVANVS